MSFKGARWLERLQQYEFEIIHRKGELHRNDDGFESRHPCLDNDCNYCAKVEFKENSSKEGTVARIILEGDVSEKWHRNQLADSMISVFLKRKESNKKPFFSGSYFFGFFSKNLFILLECFVFKRWCSSQEVGIS